MTRFLAVAVALILPVLASATCTWTQPSNYDAKVVCTSANEAVPTLATQGMDVSQCLKGVSVFICADSGKVFTATGTVKVYVYNPIALLWGELPDRAMTPTTVGRCQAFDGIWSVVALGRFAVVPISVGVGAGGFTAWLTCN